MQKCEAGLVSYILISEFGRLDQEGHGRLEASLGYTIIPSLKREGAGKEGLDTGGQRFKGCVSIRYLLLCSKSLHSYQFKVANTCYLTVSVRLTDVLVHFLLL